MGVDNYYITAMGRSSTVQVVVRYINACFYYWNNDKYSPESSSSNKMCAWEKNNAEIINSSPTNNRWAY